MVLARLVDLELLTYPRGSIFQGVKCSDYCDNSIVNPFMDLEFSFIIDPMDSVELDVRDVLDILWWLPSYCPCSTNNINTE